MIPRKRLQVLLYILQIFYVFGDGDPGSEGLLELANNVIDEPTYTTKTPYMHNIQEIITSAEGNRIFNDSSTLINTSSTTEYVENVSSEESVTVTTTETSGISTTIEKVTIDDMQSTFLNISWSVLGNNASLYLVGLYSNGKSLQNYTTTNLSISLMDLNPCTNYEVGVAPFLNESKLELVFVKARTKKLQPGPVMNLKDAPTKPGSLEINWQIPEVAHTCVKSYRIIVDTEKHENRHTVTAHTNETRHIFENLYACTTYWITVVPIDIDEGDGISNRKESSPTLREVTSAPRLNTTDVKSIIMTKNSTTMIWHIADKRNNCSLESVVTECTYNYTEGYGFRLYNGSSDVHIPKDQHPENVTIKVTDLSPFTHYVCKAQIINEAGTSDWSLNVKVQTSEDTPSPPHNFQNIGRDQNSKLLFIWEPPTYRPGRLQNYRINFTWVPKYPVPDECNLDRTTIIDKIDSSLTQLTLLDEEARAHYYARISAKTGAGWSQEVERELDSKSGGVPDQVTNLTCIIRRRNDNPNALDTILSWGLPCLSRGSIYRFDVSVFGTRLDHENHSFTDVVNVPDDYKKNDLFTKDFGELRPLYTYTFIVSASIHGGTAEPGESSDLIVTYPAGIPPQPEEEYIKSITLDPQKARRTTSSAAILLPLFPDENGEVKYYAIIVSGVPFDNSSKTEARFDIEQERWPDISSWEEAMEKDFKIPYQATEPKWNPFPNHVVDYGHMKAVKFVIGEDTTCPEVSSNTKTRAYCNGPLKPDTWYEVRMRAFTEHGYADSVPFTIKTNAELNVGLVLGVVFGILFIGILTTLLLLIKRCSFRLLVQRILQSNIPESPVPNPFTRRKFINHCQQLADNPGKLGNEFQLLQTLSVDLQMPSNAACLQANRKKNRYSDILPYDFSRVKLDIIDNDPNTDYINASFVRGYSGNEEYIACQGPKEDTTYDFWRMIDQYDIKMIVMLTQLVERGKEKCHQYFPIIRETFNYEKFSIRCTSELDYRTYTQRTFVLQKENQRRTITHLHFKDWPDHDVPDDFEAMIHFCQMFRKQMATLKGLSVIHCSAGIGRTGTLIAIDILLQAIRDNRKIDVFGTVYRLRRHRLNMVQRENQYAYIYNCIRQVLKNPYFLKSYKPPPIDPIYSKDKTIKKRSDSNTDLVDSFDTLRKNSLSTSVDSMHPLCQSSPQATPKIQMNVLFAGLRYCKSTSAIDTRSNHNRIGRYNSEGYAICESARDSFSTTSKESAVDDNDLKSSSSSLYENVEPLIRPSSSQTIAGSNYYLTNENVEKDTSL